MLFLDTNVLLDYSDNLEEFCPFAISSVSLQELESIKTNRNKTEDVKHKARKATQWLSNNPGLYSVQIYTDIIGNLILSNHLEIAPDTKIIACASYVSEFKDIEFFTNDLCCSLIASEIFKLKLYNFINEKIDYKGFKTVILNDEEMANFYGNLSSNVFDLLINEYLIIKNTDGDIVDTYKWDGFTHIPIFKKTLKSIHFEKLKPKDVYQSCVVDSLINHTITAISGKAGSGKSLLSLMAAMYLIENGKYDRIVVLFNPTKARGASDLGFYSGDFIDKAMSNSIGQILTTKFGDRYAVDVLMSQNKLKLVSMADCRGMEIGDNEILWITEAQNTSIDLIKLCLSRVSSGAKVFIEGDYTSQVDSNTFEGSNNGLKRIIDAFKNHEEFGYIQLQNVWRSKIAELCELL